MCYFDIIAHTRCLALTLTNIYIWKCKQSVYKYHICSIDLHAIKTATIAFHHQMRKPEVLREIIQEFRKRKVKEFIIIFVRLFAYQVEWSPVPPHQDMVYSLPNGSLLFYPFSAEKYRHEIHSTVYRQEIKFSTFSNDKLQFFFVNVPFLFVCNIFPVFVDYVRMHAIYFLLFFFVHSLSITWMTSNWFKFGTMRHLRRCRKKIREQSFDLVYYRKLLEFMQLQKQS